MAKYTCLKCRRRLRTKNGLRTHHCVPGRSRRNPMVNWTAFPPAFEKPYDPEYNVDGYYAEARPNPVPRSAVKAIEKHVDSGLFLEHSSKMRGRPVEKGRGWALGRMNGDWVLFVDDLDAVYAKANGRRWDRMRDTYLPEMFPYGTKSSNNGKWARKNGLPRKSRHEILQELATARTWKEFFSIGRSAGMSAKRLGQMWHRRRRSEEARENGRHGFTGARAKAYIDRRMSRRLEDTGYGHGHVLLKAKQSAAYRVNRDYDAGLMTRRERDKALRAIDRASTMNAAILLTYASSALYEDEEDYD